MIKEEHTAVIKGFGHFYFNNVEKRSTKIIELAYEVISGKGIQNGITW